MISFCIITDGREPAKTSREIQSINALHIPFYEILLGGNIPDENMVWGIKSVDMHEHARAGRLGAMRNALCRRAAGDILVVADDDMVFHSDFYQGVLWHQGKFDVLACRILNPDGTRFWDWATYKGPNGHALLDYDKTDYENMYVSGGLITMKRYVFDECQWDENLGFYQNEDIDFSEKLKARCLRFIFNPFSTVTHDAPYTQVGKSVVRTR